MNKYWYKATSYDGEIKYNNLECENLNCLKNKLESNGYLLIWAFTLPKFIISLKNTNKLKSKELSDFFEQLHMLLISGIPLENSLEIIGKNDFKLKKFTNSLIHNLNKGKPISEVLIEEEYPKLLISIVSSGENTGNIEESCFKLSEYYKKITGLKSKLISKLSYPLILLLSIFVLITYIFKFTLPMVIDLFTTNGVDLPMTINFLSIFISRLNKYKLIIFLLVIMLFLLIYKSYRNDKNIYHKVFCNLYFIGDIIKLINQILFFEIQYISLSSNIHLINSFDIGISGLNNLYIKNCFEAVRDYVKEGGSYSEKLKEIDILSDVVVRLISIGEQTGNLKDSCKNILKYLYMELNKKLDKLFIIIEPVILLALAITIGFIAYIVITPIFQMTNINL